MLDGIDASSSDSDGGEPLAAPAALEDGSGLDDGAGSLASAMESALAALGTTPAAGEGGRGAHPARQLQPRRGAQLATLGLAADGAHSAEDIRRAYLRRALASHPDKGGDVATFAAVRCARQLRG